MPLLRKSNRRREYTERGRGYAIRGYRFSIRYVIIPFAIIVLILISILGGVEEKDFPFKHKEATPVVLPSVTSTPDLQDCTLETRGNEYIFRC
jgi:hypothetical protein